MSTRAFLVAALAGLVLVAGCTVAPPPEVPTPLSGPSAQEEVGGVFPAAASGVVEGANLTVEVLDVGQGDAIVVHAPNATMLVDTGTWRQASREALLDHLARDGIQRVDLLVVTHPDADHAGGCARVLEAYPVARVVHPGLGKATQTWQDCREAIRAEGARVGTDGDLDPGDVLDVAPGLGVQVLWIDDDRADVNAGSVVLRVSYGSSDVLLTGDVPCRVEQRILAMGLPVEAELLKVAHHGSRSSTCADWLDAANPVVALVSVGEGNPYGHPHAEVLDRLHERGIQVHRTDREGALAWTTNGSAWAPLAATAPAPASANASRVRVVDVHADAPGNDHEDPNGEWVALGVSGNASMDLSGWRLEDAEGHAYRFPAGARVGPDASLRVHTGSGADNRTDLYWGRARAVWDNAGDTARLLDAGGRVVDEESYP